MNKKLMLRTHVSGTQMKQMAIKLFCLILAVGLLAGCSGTPASVPASSAPQMLPSIIPPPPPAPSSSAAPSIAPYQSPIDFYDLLAQGPDICAWLTVDGTNIDYPVTRGIDNAYYLTHDAYGAYFAGGAIFTDMINAADFSDPVTVLYGHFMPDDTIFSQLHLFKDPDFYAENRTVTLYLPDNCHTYEVFAAFPHDESNLLYEKDYTDPAVFEGLLDYIEQQAEDAPGESHVGTEGITAGDKLLLLSTCDNEGASRYLVAARLVEKAAEC